jgi:TRAP-type C4-dicarboxylate transport system substrate-binding protein
MASINLSHADRRVDGGATTGYESGQHYRTPSTIRAPAIYHPELLVFSKKSWEGLSKEYQALVAKFAKEAQQEQRTLWYEREKTSIEILKKAGIEINEVADKKQFQAAVKPVWDKYGAQHAALIQRIQDVK